MTADGIWIIERKKGRVFMNTPFKHLKQKQQLLINIQFVRSFLTSLNIFN